MLVKRLVSFISDSQMYEERCDDMDRTVTGEQPNSAQLTKTDDANQPDLSAARKLFAKIPVS